MLLDECVPRKLRRELLGHEVRTVQETGWTGTKNGALLQLANGRFEVLLTVDQRIEYQQNLESLAPPGLAVLIMVARSNNVDDLRPLMPGVRDALRTVRAGEVIRVSMTM